MMKRMILAVALLGATALAAEPQVVYLWPGVAPGSESWTQTEEQDPSHGEGIGNFRNVTRPALLVFLPPPAAATGRAIVVCPGGGFTSLVIGKEGEVVARWLNSMGIAAFVLKYRLARTGDADAKDPAKAWERKQAVMPLAVADAQQAMRLVRSRAAEWGVARDHVGIMGLSAGGYLSTSVALRHDADSRPEFAAAIYGAAPPDLTVPADAPPMFLAHAYDDGRVPPVDTSVRVYSAWSQAGIPAELHIYARGGHGFALRKNGLPVNTWPDRFRDWLADLDRVKAAAAAPQEPKPAVAGPQPGPPASPSPGWAPPQTELHGSLTPGALRALPESAFAFPQERKEPLTDAAHVRAAIARFSQVKNVSDEERALAFANLKKAAAYFNVRLQAADWHQLMTGTN